MEWNKDRPHRIRDIRVFRMDIPLHQPFVISLETIRDARNVLVVLDTVSGLTGFGECSPYASIHGETQESCLAQAAFLAPRIMDQEPWNLQAWEKALDYGEPVGPCIRSAFDMAMYDLAAQIAGMPLYAYLGGDTGKVMHTDMTVGIGAPEQMAASARRYVDDGFTAIKLKLGTDVAEDVRRVAAVRKALGPALPLRIDANQGWTPADAEQALMQLLPFQIEYCEQPVRAALTEEMARLTRLAGIPVMADESLFGPTDALRLVGSGACHGFNIKISKAGGIRPAQVCAFIAQAASLPCQVGCFSESRLGITALAHFALAHPAIVHFDMDSPFMLREDPIRGGISYSPSRQVLLGSGLGIGCVVNLGASCLVEVMHLRT